MKLDRRGFLFSLPAAVVAAKAGAVEPTFTLPTIDIDVTRPAGVPLLGIVDDGTHLETIHAQWVQYKAHLEGKQWLQAK